VPVHRRPVLPRLPHMSDLTHTCSGAAQVVSDPLSHLCQRHHWCSGLPCAPTSPITSIGVVNMCCESATCVLENLCLIHTHDELQGLPPTACVLCSGRVPSCYQCTAPAVCACCQPSPVCQVGTERPGFSAGHKPGLVPSQSSLLSLPGHRLCKLGSNLYNTATKYSITSNLILCRTVS
jgi:hypothetical protein